MRYFVTTGSRTFEVDLTGDTPLVDGQPVEAALSAVPGTAVRHLLADGRSHAIVALGGERRGQWEVTLDAERFSLAVVDERTRAIREMTGAAEVETARSLIAPMPGMVMRVEVQEGDHVRAGQGLVVVEAMKMENELKAPADGIVARVAVAAGQKVEKGATLVVME
jgi:biotin carboxyl carrier protein